MIFFFDLSLFPFSVSLVFTTNIAQEETVKNIFQEVLTAKGFDVLVRDDLSFILDEREKISLKAFKSKDLKELKASNSLIIVSFQLLDSGTYDVSLKVVNVQSGEIIIAKSYETPELHPNNIREIAVDFAEKLMKFIDYSQSMKRPLNILLLSNERSGPYILRVTGIKNGWVKIFKVEKDFLELIYEFQILANEEHDFILSNKKGLKFKILWLPKYVPIENLESFKLRERVIEGGIENWYIKDIEL